jgi:hypothetical protein
MDVSEKRTTFIFTVEQQAKPETREKQTAGSGLEAVRSSETSV